MTRSILNKLLFAGPALGLLGLAATALATVPSMEVTVFDAGGNVTFRGPMSANTTFATPNLRPGHYVVQFKTKSSVVKNQQYFLVISSGRKKVIADAVPGEKLNRGGVVMKIEVVSGLPITGQVANGQIFAVDGPLKYRLLDGRRYFWEPAKTGSYLQGHWVEAGLPPAQNVGLLNKEDFRKRQDRAGEGSMIGYHDDDELPGNKGY